MEEGEILLEEGRLWAKEREAMFSTCIEKMADTISNDFPVDSDIYIQRAKDPPPADFKDLALAAASWNAIKGVAFAFSKPDASMTGIGPNDEKVSWSLTPGDGVWASSGDIDHRRHMGVYIGAGRIVDLGLARRERNQVTVYWGSVIPGKDEEQRGRVVDVDAFTGRGSLRCGVFATSMRRPRGESVRTAIACVGTALARLVKPDAQHIAVYIVRGVWLASSPVYRAIKPIKFSGSFEYTAQVDPGFAVGKSNCTVDITGSRVITQRNQVRIEYDLQNLGDDMQRQMHYMLPFHEPFIDAYLSEDDAATIIARGRESL